MWPALMTGRIPRFMPSCDEVCCRLVGPVGSKSERAHTASAPTDGSHFCPAQLPGSLRSPGLQGLHTRLYPQCIRTSCAHGTGAALRGFISRIDCGHLADVAR